MKNYSLFCLFLLLCNSSSALALGLTEMQAEAVNSREIIKRYQVSLEKSGRDVEIVKSSYYPKLNVGYQANNLDEASAFEHRQNSSVYATASMNIFAGFRDRYALESAQVLEKVDGYRLNGIEQDIQLNVALRYLSVYERRANLTVARDNLKTLQRLYQDGQRRLQVGLIGQNELLKIKVDLDNSDITMKKGQADLDKSIQLLGREINRQLDLADLDFAEFDVLPKLEDYEMCKEKMLHQRSELLALTGLAESAFILVKAERGSYYPRLDLVGRYSRYDDDLINGNGDINDDEFRAQLVLSMNIFDGFARESSVARARLSAREIEYDIEELRNSLVTDLANIFIDYRVSTANVEVAAEDIRHAEENLRITQLKYKQGLQRESDLLDAVTNLSRARYNQVAVIRTVFENALRATRMTESFPYRAGAQ